MNYVKKSFLLFAVLTSFVAMSAQTVDSKLLDEAKVLIMDGELERADSLLNIIDGTKERSAIPDSSIATAYEYLARMYLTRSEGEKALNYINKAMTLRKGIFDEESLEIAVCYQVIGMAYVAQGNYSLSIFYLKKVLAMKTKLLGENSSDVEGLYHALGAAYAMRGYFPMALDYYRKSLEISKMLYGEEGEQTLKRYTDICGLYEMAAANNYTLDGRKEFDSGLIYIFTVDADTDTPAKQQGLVGDYIVLEFNDWNCTQSRSLAETFFAAQRKVFVLMKDGVIKKYTFEDVVGAESNCKCLTKAEKQKIVQQYLDWKALYN